MQIFVDEKTNHLGGEHWDCKGEESVCIKHLTASEFYRIKLYDRPDLIVYMALKSC